MTATTAWIVTQVGSSSFHYGQSSKVAGNFERAFVAPWAKVAGDGDGSIYYVAELPSNAVLKTLLLNNDALAGATGVTIGVMKLNADGTISDTAKSDGTSAAALFMASTNIASGNAIGSDLNAMSAISIANLGKKLWDLLGYTFPNNKKDDSYVLTVSFVTAGSAAGNLCLRGSFING